MGPFIGHLVPGLIFLLLGLLWTYKITRRAIMCRDKKRPFYNTVTYPLHCHRRCIQWPIEAGLKVFMGALGVVTARQGHGTKATLFQHMTMYALFGVSGIIDILARYKKVPRGLDHLAMAMAFLGEGILFMHHTHGDGALHGHVHTLLKYSVFACVVVCLMELSVRNSQLMALTKAFAVCVHGSWFIHVGAILYPVLGLSEWDLKADENLMMASMMFTWHFLGVSFLMAMLSVVAYQLNTKHCRPSTEEYNYEILPLEISSEEEDGNEQDKDQVDENKVMKSPAIKTDSTTVS